MEPTPRLSVEVGMQDDDNMSSNTFLKLNYILCCNDRRIGPPIFAVSSNAYNYGKIDSQRMYEKVRRENNIITVRGGGEFVVTASRFSMKKLIYIFLIIITPLVAWQIPVL